MKRITSLFFVFLTSLCSLTAWAAETLTVIANSNSGIKNANYTGTLADSTILGFYRSGSSVYFCGAIGSSNSIEVPDTIAYNNNLYKVSVCGYDYYNNLDFDEATSVSSLTLPSTITKINSLSSSVNDLHLKSLTPPSLYDSSSIPSRITIWVPQSVLPAYTSLITNTNSYWYGKDVHYEGWEPKVYTINVRTAGSLANELLKVIDQWTDVDELTIIGTLNAEDMKMFSRMTQLTKLDLSQTDIKEIGGCSGLTKLATVLLPSTVTTIIEESFMGCSKLSSINLTNIVTIEKGAFAGCACIRSLNLPSAKVIGDSAFDCNTDIESSSYYYYYYRTGNGLISISLPVAERLGRACFCGNVELANVQIPNVKYIGEGAFSNCSNLTEMDLSNVSELGAMAFYMHEYAPKSLLKKVVLSNEVTSIAGTFNGCVSLTDLNIPTNLKSISLYNVGLTSVILPEGLTTINNLSSSSFTTISIPSTVTSISNSAFKSCSSLKDLYCYSVVPINTTAFNTDKNSYDDLNPSGIALHIPAFSIAAYKLDDNWYRFGKIVPIDVNITNITISQDFSIYEYTGISEKVNLSVLSGYDNNSNSGNFAGHLTVSASDKWNIGEYLQTQSNRYNSDYYWDDNGNRLYTYNYYNSTLIPYNEMNADNVTVKYSAQTNRWNFISFPFDVNVSDIQYPEGTLWVIRKYSGEDRAKMTGNTWQNMTNGMTLKAGEGYILHCTDGNTSSYVEFTFKAVNNSSKNNIFAYQDVAKPLSKYASDLAHNRNWNLVGNPYPCFYDTRNIEHNGVITVWNGNGYTAYSLLDDKYILRPHESFFVQCPADATSMTFKAEGRQHTYKASSNASYAKAARVASANNRQVFNLTLSGAEYTDKARVVINESAKLDYEISCDASKFMSSNTTVPQIYIIENGQKMAIDERPLSDGAIALGMYIGEAGDYTIGMSTAITENVVLKDNATDKTTNLNNETYTFTASKGTIDNRFSINIGNDATGINNLKVNEVDTYNIYNVNGQRISAPQKGINIVNGKKTIVR